mgnify:FL=1
MGGQVGDSGKLTDDATGEAVDVYDTKRENGVAVHLVAKMPSNPEATFTAAINVERRQQIECNHTATHLLHYALRQVLGSHVEQKGSYVSADSFRFDFSHFQKVTPEELRHAERIANALVRKAIPLDEHRDCPIAEAREMGALALFGEKYGDRVRVVRYGDSIELCGGTHVANTGNIGMIKILSESSVAAGVRRIEAVTASHVEDMIDSISDDLRQFNSLLNNVPNALQALRNAIEENTSLKKQVQQYFEERVNALAARLIEKSAVENGIRIVTMSGLRLPEMPKAVAMAVRRDSPENTAFIAATVNPAGVPQLTVALTEDLVKGGLNASNIVRAAAKLIKGGGGGQPGFAQAGGKDKDNLAQALEALRSALLV